MKKLREIFNAIFRRRQNRNNAPQNQPDNVSQASTNQDSDLENTAPTKRQLGQGRYDETPEFDNAEVNNQDMPYNKRELGQGRYDEMPEFDNAEVNNQDMPYNKRDLGQGRYDGVQEGLETEGNRESFNIDDFINQPSTRRASTGLPSVLDDGGSTLSRASITSKKSTGSQPKKKTKPSL